MRTSDGMMDGLKWRCYQHHRSVTSVADTVSLCCMMNGRKSAQESCMEIVCTFYFSTKLQSIVTLPMELSPACRN